MKWPVISLLFFILIYTCMPVNSEDGFAVRYPNRQLQNVPSDVDNLVTLLDLSQNDICRLQKNDFMLLTKLSILNLSHNLIDELDGEVFQSNMALKHLDVSHNKLRAIKCSSLHFIKNIKHLNMAYNSFETMNLCKEVTSLSKLEYLGLSSVRMKKENFINIAHRELGYVFLGIEDLQEYEAGSIQLLNTTKLHINLPKYLQSTSLLYDALNTSPTLEISHIICEQPCDYPTSTLSKINKNSRVSTLILSNITMPWNEMSSIIQAVWRSSVEHFHIYLFTLVYEFKYVQLDYSIGSLKSITIDHVIPKVFFFTHPHPITTFTEMLVENFTFSNAEITHLFCPPRPSIFRFLNLANNRITHEIFINCNNLTSLELLNLQSNKFEKISKASVMTSTMRSLKHLDLSKNTMYYEQDEGCSWTESLVYLNLSENKLTAKVFACLPMNVQILDLSMNKIANVPKEVENFKSLRELNLASNLLVDIPDCHYLSRNLGILKVDENFIHTPSITYFQSCGYNTRISAGHNPFQCNCELREFARTEKIRPGKLSGWPESYRCEYPEDFKGVLLKDFHLSEISCNIYILLATVLGTILVLLVCIIFSCIYFDLPWYIRMLFQWVRTKQRVRNINLQDIQKGKYFHAFVSYSEQDSVWVKNILIPNLERSDGSIKICQHERHFIPGKAIIENIIHCIEQSFRSIFILSPNFIQSEWCHYELYFAQHALFGKSYNNLILILLDPIPQYVIPNTYSKLKTIMKHRTYLEWPKEKGKQGLFWANLREAIHINLPTDDQELINLDLEHQRPVTPE
ncbi:toll-like receptor 1 [Pelodytes ibericus]